MLNAKCMCIMYNQGAIGQESKRQNQLRHGRLQGDSASVQYCPSSPLPPSLASLTAHSQHSTTQYQHSHDAWVLVSHIHLFLFKFKLKLSQISHYDHILALKI